jgi:hypothetical protein
MSLLKCLVSFPIDAADLEQVRRIMSDAGGNEAAGIKSHADTLASELEGLRKQLSEKGHDVGLKPSEPTAEVKITDPEIKQAVNDAKAEGFDPISNTNDHELDMQSLRDQGLLTPEDEAALKAADETHDTVGAWEDVMNAARECFLS